MPGHIEEIIKNKLYKIIVEAGKDPKTGERRRVVRRYKGKKSEAIDIMALLIAELEQGTHVDKSKMTVGEWIETWLEDYKKPVLRSSTYSLYIQHFNKHIMPAIGPIPIQKLTTDHIQQLYNSLLKAGKSTSVINQIHLLINGALKKALKKRLINYNPDEETARPPVEAKELKILTPEEQDMLLQALHDRPRGALFALMICTGLRRGELLGLHWDDINLEEKVLYVRRGIVNVNGQGIKEEKPKTKKGRRTVPLPKMAIDFLRRHQEFVQKKGLYKQDGIVFPSRVGTYIWPRNLNRSLERLTKKLGLKVKPHILRHTFASRLLEEGEDLRVIQELLGHAKEWITADIYIHISEKLKRRAVDKLDGVFGTSGTNRAPNEHPQDNKQPENP